MPDEDVGTHADEFPENEHHHEIVREDDPEHGKEEQREPGEEARVALLLAHVAHGVDEHERRNGGHDEQHHPAEVVEDEADGDREVGAEAQPGVAEAGLPGRLGENPPAERATGEGREDREAGAERAGEFPEQHDQHRRRERGHQDNPGRGLEAHQNFSVARSSTCVVCFERKRATMIASPTATSAAATVMMKKTKTWPL